MSRVHKKGRFLTERDRRDNRLALLNIVPIFIWYLLFNAVPIGIGVYLAFSEWNALTAAPRFIGLRNFENFFRSPDYIRPLFRQLYIGGMAVATNFVLSFFLGLMLNVPIMMKGFFRVCDYMPSVTAVSTTTAVFVALLMPFDGGLNSMLQSFGMSPVIWTHSTYWMIFWIVMYTVWRSMGPSAILWLSGLQSIDPQLYEAARVDGASKLQEVIHVTIPGLRFTAAFIVLTGIIGMMQMFDAVMFISAGGPVGTTDVIAFRIFRDGARSFNLGMAGASSVIVGVITLVFSVIFLNLWLNKNEKEAA
jgi:ABC-type sugar transport system permease subunit